MEPRIRPLKQTGRCPGGHRQGKPTTREGRGHSGKDRQQLCADGYKSFHKLPFDKREFSRLEYEAITAQMDDLAAVYRQYCAAKTRKSREKVCPLQELQNNHITLTAELGERECGKGSPLAKERAEKSGQDRQVYMHTIIRRLFKLVLGRSGLRLVGVCCVSRSRDQRPE